MPRTFSVRFTAGSGSERTIEWFGTEHLPTVCRIPGVLRARLFETDEAISQIMTEERTLYGAGPGKERFLVTYELTSAGTTVRLLRQTIAITSETISE
jgi:hypothetical protein